MLDPEASKRLVALAALDYLPENYHSLAAQACEQARVELSPWRRAVSRTPGREWPTLAIAGLASGVRRLAPDLNALLTEEYPRLPLLLLCEEGLVRPTVVSHGGRLVLLGSPLSRSRVSSRIKMLAANADHGGPPRWSELSSADCQIRDRLESRYWVGVLQRGPGSNSPAFDTGKRSALIALLPLGQEPASGELLASVARELGGTASPPRKEAALAELLGNRYAAIYLPVSATEWSIYLPCSPLCLRLCSPQRLPRIWDQGGSVTRPTLFTTTAASGDLLILSDAAQQTLWPEDTTDAWDGGPALLGSLGAREAADKQPFSVVLVEIL